METQAETRTPTIRLWNSINYVIWWLRLTMQRQTKTHIRTHPRTPHTHTTHHTHTHTHTHFITSAPSWNWESLLEFIFLGSKETWFISWGLQQIDVDEETPRSARLNVDSHFWMLEDWVLSKINVVELEDWNFWLERIFVLIHDTWACFGQDSCTPWWRFGRLLVASL